MRLERLNWREAEAYFKTHDLVLLNFLVSEALNAMARIMRLEQTH